MSLEDMVSQVRQSSGALALAVISRDGVVIAADMPRNVSKETFSIMCATILGAGMTAASELNKTPPVRVVLHSDDVDILILEAGRRALVTAVIPPESDVDGMESKLKDFISKIQAQV